MEKSKTTQPIPAGYHTVTPWMISRKTAELLDFVKQAFGAEEIGRIYNPDGTIGHAETRIGDSVVMMFDAKENWLPTPCFLRLYVEDANAVFQQALKAGATVVTEITEWALAIKWGVSVIHSATSGGYRNIWKTFRRKKWGNVPKTATTPTPCSRSNSRLTAK